ncbi:transcriptional regulator, partial [Lacticaseibacillus rhamnosus MTCC 5462]
MKKILVRVLLVVLVAALGFGGFVYYMVHNSTSQIYSYNKKTNKSSDDKPPAKAGRILTARYRHRRTWPLLQRPYRHHDRDGT